MANAQLHGVLQHLHSLHDTRALAEASDAQLLAWFAGAREEAPFAALVRRHGPMVWSVSRRLLPREQDAEDVFQATFLLLARKAASIRKAEAVGSWLHGVAHRLALKVRVQQARRRAREKRVADMRQTQPGSEARFSEVQALLDAALGALPEKYRAALVLCYLEGQTQEEAARRLGCPLATLRTRVARGRKLLRERLANHGLTLSTAGLATLLIASAAPATAPTALGKATVKVAIPFAAGQTAAVLCSPQAADLVEGGLRALFLTKITMATALLLAATLLAGAAALTQRVTAADEVAESPAVASAPSPAPPTNSPAADTKDSVAYGGRVLGPDGRPVAGAKLHMTIAWGYPHHPAPSPEYATTGPDGRFAFTVSKAEFGDRVTVVAATAANHGAGWVKAPASGKRDDLTLRLVEDDVPITGQIVDLEAKPVPGATLTALQINAAPGEDLGPWLEAVQGKKGLSLQLEQQYLKRFTIALPLKATTDGAGRFRLPGIGRNRLVRVQLDGPTIASQQLCILTRPGEAIQVTEHEGRPEYRDPRVVTTYHGAAFRLVAAPTKPIVGVVRDKDTKKPLAGVSVRSYARAISPGHFRIVDIVQTTTDAEGHYRLTGLPKGEGFKIMVVPGGDQPYLIANKDVPDTPGLDPVTIDFELKRGVWIEGQITDKVTGKPVQAAVEYFALRGNPNLHDYPGYDGTIPPYYGVRGKADGSYRVVGLPGPGLLAVWHVDPYLRAPDREDAEGVKKASLSTAPYALLPLTNYSALARIDPAREVDPVKRDVALDPGWTFTGTVVGPDGKPLIGARKCDLNGSRWWEPERMKTAAITGWFNPRRPRDVLFQHPEAGLVGVVQPPKENGGSITVRLEPGATIRGRLVDANGRPQAGAELEVKFHPKAWGSWFDYSPERIRTDLEGRFRLAALLPGYKYRLSDDKGELQVDSALHSGQTKDLGDVQLKLAQE